MKLYELVNAINNKEQLQIVIMRSPADLAEWVVWVRDESAKSYLLAHDNNAIVANRDIDKIILLLRTAGVKSAAITL